MSTPTINHVSVNARDLDASAAFYVVPEPPAMAR
jgi:hypothetical protein